MNPSAVTLRQVRPEDVAALRDISRQTFVETFADSNTAGNLQAYIDARMSPEKLLEELRHPQSVFFFAEHEGKVCGYLKVNTGEAQTELKNDGDAAELERIYVLKASQGLQIGKLLFEKSRSLARAQGKRYLWLGVWEHNTKAIAFYQKQGMQPFDKHIFVVGDDPQTDIMMKLML